jgi:hypothetical protein
MTPRLRRNGRVSYQLVENGEPKEDFVTNTKSTFSITIKGDDGKIIYENDKEPYTYDSVDSIHNALRYFGAKLDDGAMSFLNDALTGDDTGKAVKKIIDLVNAKLKADAKSNAYASVINKKKPLEGEKKESAMARLVANFMKLANSSKEDAIETLKMGKALPPEYTVADFDATPLRRSKGDSEDE